MNHHPTWAEVRPSYMSELEKDQAAWRFYQKLREEYAPVPRDRASERQRMEDTRPGYKAARAS